MRTLLVFFALTTGLSATEFSFFSILRAGSRGAGDWEVGIGQTGSTISSSSSYSYLDNNPTWGNDEYSKFRIGYNATTNTAYTTVWSANGADYSVKYAPTNAFTVPISGTWTVKLTASATPANTSTRVDAEKLQLSNGLTVLQPLTTTSLIASQPKGPSTVTLDTPIVFRPTKEGGDWYIDGIIRFAGLETYVGSGGATRSQLQFSLTAVATANPEPAAVVLILSGLGAMAVLRRRANAVSA